MGLRVAWCMSDKEGVDEAQEDEVNEDSLELSRRASDASVISVATSPIMSKLRSSLHRNSVSSSPRRRVYTSRKSLDASTATPSRTRTPREHSHREPHHERLDLPVPRRYSDSYIDFRPAAARAGLYPNRTLRPLHFHHQNVLQSLKWFVKHKGKSFWHGQSRYSKIHFVTFFILSFIAGFIIFGVEHEQTVSMVTGTGLNTTDFTKLHLFTKIFAMLLGFGGSPLTVVLPITLVIRKHCTDPKPRSALMRLFIICVIYYVVFIIVPFLIYGFYLNYSDSKHLLNGINPFWFAIFHSISAFTNSGLSLLPDSLVRFATDYVINLITAFQIIFGYMAIPLALRFFIWISTFLPYIDKKPSLMLLQTPAFAGYLFPRVETQVITLVLIGIIVVGTASNVIFEWNESLRQFSPAHKFLVAFFNDVTTRNAGLNTIDFSTNYDVTNLIAIFWMYIAGYPVGARVSRSMQPHLLGEVVGFYFKKQVSNQRQVVDCDLLAHHFIYRTTLEGDPNFTFFKVLFEVISAYGTVGLSLGYPDAPFSFCGVWRDVSKICVIFLMFIGRHRRLKGTLLNSVYEANMIGNPFAEQLLAQHAAQSEEEDL